MNAPGTSAFGAEVNSFEFEHFHAEVGHLGFGFQAHLKLVDLGVPAHVLRTDLGSNYVCVERLTVEC